MNEETSWRLMRLAGAISVPIALLAACGGGGSDTAALPAGPTAVTITGKAVDGALQGATACYDLNDNGVRDHTGTVLANSVTDFSGTQGNNGWYYGFYSSPFTSSTWITPLSLS